MEASNLQELKDAAIELMKFTCASCEQRFCEEDVEEEDGQRVPSPCSAIIRMRNALSANPIRNCDVGTAEEQAERYGRYCDKFTSDGMHCENCPCCGKIPFGKCEFVWSQMPYEEGGAK